MPVALLLRPRPSISRRTAAATRAAVQAAEQFQPPSKTGAERLRHRCSQPEPQPGLAQVSKSVLRALPRHFAACSSNAPEPLHREWAIQGSRGATDRQNP